MDWVTPVDIYCERTGPGFWAEPVNAWSNLAFLFAALWAARAGRRRGEGGAFWALVGLTALVGVGSFLFHTVAQHWAELLDVAPIWLFVGLYIDSVVARLKGGPPRIATRLAIGAGVAATIWFSVGHEQSGAAHLNGALQYAPALLALIALALILRRRGLAAWRLAGGAAAVFALSLTLRSVDMAVCAAAPRGVHFFWHILNAAMMALLLAALTRLPTSMLDRACVGGFRARSGPV